MLLRTYHRTIYNYSTPSSNSHNEVRLEPTSDSYQNLRSFRISTTPTARIFDFQEVGGKVHHFTLRAPHRSLEIEAEAVTETLCKNPFERVNLVNEDLDRYSSDAMRQRYAEFLVPSRYVTCSDQTRELAESVLAASDKVAAHFLINLNRYIYDTFSYDPDVTHVHSTVEEVLELRAGVCQDYAHVMIACCRSIGIPARYVSGYLYCSKGSGIRGSSAMHAWVECPTPDGDWISLDPTNNLLANDHYIRVHTGRDYGDITPLGGIYIGSHVKEMDVTISVDEVEERFQQIKVIA